MSKEDRAIKGKEYVRELRVSCVMMPFLRKMTCHDMIRCHIATRSFRVDRVILGTDPVEIPCHMMEHGSWNSEVSVYIVDAVGRQIYFWQDRAG